MMIQRERKEMEFAGKTVIVTGAARGIGREIARQFGAAGATVIVADIANSRAATEELSKDGGNFLPLALDVRDTGMFRSFVQECVRLTGRFDILVNNAGIEACPDLFDVTPAIWDEHHAVNVRSTFFLTQAVAEWMRDHDGGQIVNIASIEGATFSGRYVPYAATKSSVRGLTAACAVALAPLGIRVNAVAPGHCDTEMNKVAQDEAAMAQRRASIPMDRLGLPAEVAATVLFLASRHSSYMTGQTLTVDGGCTIKRAG